jgi:hypothetical protein
MLHSETESLVKTGKFIVLHLGKGLFLNMCIDGQCRQGRIPRPQSKFIQVKMSGMITCLVWGIRLENQTLNEPRNALAP